MLGMEKRRSPCGGIKTKRVMTQAGRLKAENGTYSLEKNSRFSILARFDRGIAYWPVTIHNNLI